MVVKLYQMKLIEGNLGKRIKPRHGPGLMKRTKACFSINQLIYVVFHTIEKKWRCIKIMWIFYFFSKLPPRKKKTIKTRFYSVLSWIGISEENQIHTADKVVQCENYKKNIGTTKSWELFLFFKIFKNFENITKKCWCCSVLIYIYIFIILWHSVG